VAFVGKFGGTPGEERDGCGAEGAHDNTHAPCERL
jgi:hypothetical protein